MEDLAIRKTKHDLHSVYYNSLYEFQSTARCDKNRDNERGGQRYLDRSSGGDWFGASGSGNDVVKKALLGDPELYSNLKGKMAKLDEELGTFRADGKMQKVVKSRRVTKFGKFGDEIDIHKVNSGKLDTAWRSKVRETFDSQHKLVTLYIDLSHNASVNCIDTLWTAAVSVKLLADLERAGKSVKIIVGGTCRNSVLLDNRHVAIGITAKEYNEKLAPERLAAMSHLGFYRSWGFSAFHDHDFGTVKSSIGSAIGSMSQTDLPINIQEEIEKGHTRLILIQKSTSSYQALCSIEIARKQIASFDD